MNLRVGLPLVLIVVLSLVAYHPVTLATPESQGPADITVLVGGGQDIDQLLTNFPETVRVRQGTTVTFRINSDEIHTVSFANGAEPRPGWAQAPLGAPGELIPTLIVPLPGGQPGELMVPPDVAFPTRRPGAPVETYSGATYASSGIMARFPLGPGAPVNDTFGLAFDTPGIYPYVCIVHPDRMAGTVEVIAPGAGDVQTREEVSARASVEVALLMALTQRAHNPDLIVPGSSMRSDPGPSGTTLWYVKAGYGDLVSGDLRAQVFGYLPRDLTVRAGDTVIWGSNYFHSITFVPTPPVPDILLPRPQPAGPPVMVANPLVFSPARPSPVYDPTQYFNSGDLGIISPGGTSWALTFDRPGTYEYLCIFHYEMGMKGTITVQAR